MNTTTRSLTVSTTAVDLGRGVFSPAERRILAGLGGNPWTAASFSSETLSTARARWSALRRAAGFAGTGGWLTTEATNPKMAKAALATIGVTLHSATLAWDAWLALAPDVQARLAGALELSTVDVEWALGESVCPASTSGCRAACVTAHSINSQPPATRLSRLTRRLLTLLEPEAAVNLTADALRRLQRRHGDKCRWRVNVSDDLRWEALAPGLFSFGVPAYTYTKWSPVRRPGRPGLSIVYSATEHMSLDRIKALTSGGHRVAVVFDVRPGHLPTSWNGMQVVDGDKTDDLWSHPAGTIVGLCRKGTTAEVFEQMRSCGFSRPV